MRGSYVEVLPHMWAKRKQIPFGVLTGYLSRGLGAVMESWTREQKKTRAAPYLLCQLVQINSERAEAWLEEIC